MTKIDFHKFYKNEVTFMAEADKKYELYVSELCDKVNACTQDPDCFCEKSHDFIQIMFPNAKSGVAHEGDILTYNEIVKIKKSNTAKQNINKCISAILKYWMIHCDNDLNVTEIDDNSRILRPQDHNRQRVTRLIKFLILIEHENAHNFANSFINHIGTLEIIRKNARINYFYTLLKYAFLSILCTKNKGPELRYILSGNPDIKKFLFENQNLEFDMAHFKLCMRSLTYFPHN